MAGRKKSIRFFIPGVLLIWLQVLSVTLAQDSLDKDYQGELPRIPPTEPRQAIAQFEIDSGLRIELVASEPQVMDPVAIAFDEIGRALVVEMRGYSEQAAKHLGRIKLLRDTDGDGDYDRATVFADNLRWPTAVCCVWGGILVGDAPDIIFLKDTDGDHRADVRQVVCSGFGTANVQQLLNNFQWGIDNYIYGASGGNGGMVRTLGSIAERIQAEHQRGPEATVDLRGRDFRIDPRSSDLSAISGGGQFGLTFDRWGNRFVCSNSDHCQFIVVEDRYLSRNKLARFSSPRISIATDGPAAEVFRISPVEPWRRVRTRLRVQGLVSGPIEGGGRAAGYFTSATGITVYDGDALPSKYSDGLFVGDVGSNLVHLKTIQDHSIEKSASRSQQQGEFLRSPDNWFRPVQMSVGPDGSLIVLDMYREVVEHPDSLPEIIKRHLDLTSGNNRGRIYRIVSKQFHEPARPMPGQASAEQLVEMLAHTNGWHRRTAARLLHERELAGAVDRLQTFALRHERPETRIRAMYLLSAFDRLPVDRLVSLFNDAHPYVRVHALRVAEANAKHPRLIQQVQALVADDDPRVRFQVALTLGQFSHREIPSALARLATHDGNNRWMRDAVISSAGPYRAELAVELMRAIRSSDALWRGVQSLLLELMGQLLQESSPRSLESICIVLREMADGDPSLFGQVLLKLHRGRDDQLGRLQQMLEQGPDAPWPSLIRRSVEVAQSTLRDPSATVEARAASIRVLELSAADRFREWLPDLLEMRQPPAIKQAALETAARFPNPDMAQPILDHLRTFNPAIRRQSLIVLLSRPSWTGQLLDRVESGAISPVFLDASMKQQLVQHSNNMLRSRAQQVLAAFVNPNRTELVAQYARQMDGLPGNPDRGRDIFRKSCAACHRLENHGNDVGPSLVSASNQGAAAILTHILDPNREVDSRYLSYTILLDNGRSYTGIIASETATSLSLQDANGSTVTMARTEIDEMQSTTKSLMPDNYENEIDVPAMADLIAYLLRQSGS